MVLIWVCMVWLHKALRAERQNLLMFRAFALRFIPSFEGNNDGM